MTLTLVSENTKNYQKYVKHLKFCGKSVENDRARANGQRQAILDVHSIKGDFQKIRVVRQRFNVQISCQSSALAEFEYKITTTTTTPNPRKIWRKARAGPYMGPPPHVNQPDINVDIN